MKFCLFFQCPGSKFKNTPLLLLHEMKSGLNLEHFSVLINNGVKLFINVIFCRKKWIGIEKEAVKLMEFFKVDLFDIHKMINLMPTDSNRILRYSVRFDRCFYKGNGCVFIWVRSQYASLISFSSISF